MLQCVRLRQKMREVIHDDETSSKMPLTVDT